MTPSTAHNLLSSVAVTYYATSILFAKKHTKMCQ
ncbi:unnamed protein product, partial [Rotaria magnacalcarata]